MMRYYDGEEPKWKGDGVEPVRGLVVENRVESFSTVVKSQKRRGCGHFEVSCCTPPVDTKKEYYIIIIVRCVATCSADFLPAISYCDVLLCLF